MQSANSCDHCGSALGHGQKLLNPAGGRTGFLYRCPTCAYLNWRVVPLETGLEPPPEQHQDQQQEQQPQQQQQGPAEDKGE
jgi:hypothetical protein